MLTSKQIENLKPGDPLVVQGEFCQAYDNGNILVSLIVQKWETSMNEIRPFHPSCVSLPSETEVPTPKHDPTRLFKEGDLVRIVKHQGRKFNAAPPAFQLGKTFRVSEDENTEHCYVMLQSCDLHYAHPVAFLELVTPVEAREPYLMLENAPSNSIEVRDKRTNKVEVTFYFGKDHAYTFEQAATRAEAERDRLNSEWRKEQDHD